MLLKILSKENLNLNEIISLSVYILISLLLILVFNFSNDLELIKVFLSFYSSSTIIFLYIFGYKSLRKLIFTQIWIITGFAHLFFFYLTKDNSNFFYKRGYAGFALAFTLLAVILIQILRLICLKIQSKELVFPGRNGFDLYDSRETNFIDFVLALIYFMSFVVFTIITLE